MAALRRVLCKYRKQCRYVVLYCMMSVFILFWIYGMKYDRSVDVNRNVGSRLEATRGGLKVGQVRDVQTVKSLTHRPSMKSNQSRIFTWSDRPDEDFDRLLDKQSFCDGRFIGYSRTFARLSHVVIDPTFGHGKRGGENISEVLNQSEDDEYYTLKPGYFRLPCKEKFDYEFDGRGHLNAWKQSIAMTDPKSTVPLPRQKQWVVAVMRYEYVNLFHTMTDFYNAFLVAKAFKMDPSNVTIMWLDGHPSGGLDSTWKVLFGHVMRASDIKTPVLFDKLVWNIVGYDSPLSDQSLPRVPSIEEFRDFFLARHGVARDYQLDCDRLNVLFIWRRDYVAHPRNPSGSVSRKIHNEAELVTSVKGLLPGHTVQGLQIDELPMHEQLEIIASTDILIGMHGAGLSHTLFLPKHSGLIEFYPTYWSAANRHFRAMAQWRNLPYSTWSNTDFDRELPNKYTIIDEKEVINMVHEMHHSLCGDKAD